MVAKAARELSADTTPDDTALVALWPAASGQEPTKSTVAQLRTAMQSNLGSAAAADTGDFATAAQGALADSAIQSADLATVATSGVYADLSGKPTLGTAADNAEGDFATAAQGATADAALPADGGTVQAVKITQVTDADARTVAAADSGKTLIYTGAGHTWTFTGSGLGAGCHGTIRNAGSGVLTISTDRVEKFSGTEPIPVDASATWEDDGTNLWLNVSE